MRGPSQPCAGPCLPHCGQGTQNTRCSPLTALFAQLALGYLIASLVYLLWARLASMGTPFADSLTPEQRAILEASRGQRRTAFFVGVLVAAATLGVLRPFATAGR